MGGEGKSRKRRSSPSSGEEEERERKKGRDKKESRRSSRADRGNEEEEEERRKNRKKKKHSDRDKSKDKERDSKERHSKEKEKCKRKDKDAGFKEISKDDYFSKNNEFATWLKEEKGKYFSDLSSESARDLFEKFVKEWNKGSCHHNITRELAAVHDQHTGGTSKREKSFASLRPAAWGLLCVC